jgi:hypothetical protein
MLRIPFISLALVLLLLLTGCPADNTTNCEDTGTCPLSCKNTSALFRPQSLNTLEFQPQDQVPKIALSTTLKPAETGKEYPIYCQGDEFDGNITLTLDDPDKIIDEAVIFLNLVKCVSTTASFCKEVQQIDIRDVFDQNNSSFTPDLNKKLYQGSEVDNLRDGVTTVINAKLNASTPIGTYALAVQIFNCTVTDPNTVGTACADKRIGIKSYKFQVGK